MSLWSTIRNALGLTPEFTLSEPAPFHPTPRAKKALERLNGGTLRVFTELAEGGMRRVVVSELGVPPPKEYPLPLVFSDDDGARLVGLSLDHDGASFTISLDLDVRAHETPNPDVRLYEATRPLHRGRPVTVSEEEPAAGLGGRLLAVEGVRSLLLRGNVVSVERQPGVAWTVLDRDVVAALRAWFLGCGPIATAEDAGRSSDPAWEQIERVLDEEVLPYVHQHGGDITLVDVKDRVVFVSLRGACASCPASMLTLKGGVQRRLMERLPGVVERVEAVE